MMNKILYFIDTKICEWFNAQGTIRFLKQAGKDKDAKIDYWNKRANFWKDEFEKVYDTLISERRKEI